MPIDGSSLIQRRKQIPFSRLDDELLAIDAEANACYSLNPTAGRVWELIAQPASLNAICRQLRQEYAVDEQVCRQEVTALLQQLHTAGLVQVGNVGTD